MRINLLNRLNLDNTFEINPRSVLDVVSSKPRNLSFSIPLQGIYYSLELEIHHIFSNDFKVTNEFGEIIDCDLGVHYRGKITNNMSSFVCLSFFEDGFNGTVHDLENKFDIHKVDGFTYRSLVVENDFEFSCSVDELEHDETSFVESTTVTNTNPIPLGLNPYVTATTINCVRCFWEIDYDIYIFHLSGTTSYITSLFAASSVLFYNDGINVLLSEIKIWTTSSPPFKRNPPPTGGNDTSIVLYDYRDYYNNNSLTFNGDFAHYLSYFYPRDSGTVTSGSRGGVSFVDKTCSSSKFSFSQIFYSPTITPLPNYSWNIYVISHEQGHMFGSEHTHACAWNGNNTAIDGCSSPQGSCPQPGLPVGGGTIMSYCHQVPSVGINFALGFGPQPQSRIVSRLNAKTCLLPCGPLPTVGVTQTPTVTPTKTPTKTINASPIPTKTPTLTPNFPCNSLKRFTPPFFVGDSVTVDGVTFTSTVSGNIFSAITRTTICLHILGTSLGSVSGPRMSVNNIPATYTLISNTSLNSITLKFGELSFNQSISFDVNLGSISVSLCDGCCSYLSGNTLYTEFCQFSQTSSWGRIVVLSSTQPFDNITITTSNPYPSRLNGIMFEVINFTKNTPLVTQPVTPTPTLTPTKTPTLTQTKTQTLTQTSSSINIIPKVDFVCVHWYEGPNSTQFINDMTDIINLYGKPIWVTEFAPQTVSSSQLEPNKYTQVEVNDFINTVIPWMNSNPMVERYAWHDSTTGTSAVFTIDGQLTETGMTYRDAQ
jgi:hypothetical protein